MWENIPLTFHSDYGFLMAFKDETSYSKSFMDFSRVFLVDTVLLWSATILVTRYSSKLN